MKLVLEARMSDEVTAHDVTEPTGSTDVPETPQSEQPVTTSGRVEDLPEFAQKMIRDLRSESASYRQRAKTAADEATQAASTAYDQKLSALNEEKAELETRLSHTDTELVRLRAALATGVRPELAEEFASRLHGSNAEEIKADAERLKHAFGITERRGDPSQGSQGGSVSGNPFADFIQSLK